MKSRRGKKPVFFPQVDLIGSLRNIWKNLAAYTPNFDSNRKKIHQKMMRDLFSQASHRSSSPKPQAEIVIGGSQGDKQALVNKLYHAHQSLILSENYFKQRLKKENHHNPQWQPMLYREARYLRQEAFYQAIKAKKDMIYESTGSRIHTLQASIDALIAQGYEVSVHLAHPENLTRKSDRQAKAAFMELGRNNHGRINIHQWSKYGSDLQCDDQHDVNQCFEKLMKTLKQRKKKFLAELLDNEKKLDITAHLEHLEKLKTQYLDKRNPHEVLMALVSDIALFPEIYIDQSEQLQNLYRLIDKNQFNVYYASIQENGPVKSHGGVMIGSSQLEKGIAFSAAGDMSRGGIHLPKKFKEKLLNELDKIQFDASIIRRFGDKNKIKTSIQKELLDSNALYVFINHCCSKNLLNEYNRVVYKGRWAGWGFELWSKPRSKLQSRDSAYFNRQFPTFLKEQAYSFFWKMIGHLQHFFTRKIALRKQTHVACSTVLQRWIELSAHRMRVDNKRDITYKKEKEVWGFDITAFSRQGGNCNTISSYLLGADPETASIFNLGACKAWKIKILEKKQLLSEYIQEFKNKFSNNFQILKEAAYQHPSIFRDLDLHFIEQLQMFQSLHPDLSNAMELCFKDFDKENDDPYQFLADKLTSRMSLEHLEAFREDFKRLKQCLADKIPQQVAFFKTPKEQTKSSEKSDAYSLKH